MIVSQRVRVVKRQSYIRELVKCQQFRTSACTTSSNEIPPLARSRSICTLYSAVTLRDRRATICNESIQIQWLMEHWTPLCHWLSHLRQSSQPHNRLVGRNGRETLGPVWFTFLVWVSFHKPYFIPPVWFINSTCHFPQPSDSLLNHPSPLSPQPLFSLLNRMAPLPRRTPQHRHCILLFFFSSSFLQGFLCWWGGDWGW